MYSRIENLLVKPYLDGSAARYLAAFGAALVNTGALLYLMLHLEPLTTQPVELLGSFAYYNDLNITNRLVAVTLSSLWALISFQIFVTCLSRMGPDEAEAHGALGYSLLPTVIWFAFIGFWHKNKIYPFLPFLSCVLCWAVLIYYPLMTGRPGPKGSATLLLLRNRLKLNAKYLNSLLRSLLDGSPLRYLAAFGAAFVNAGALMFLILIMAYTRTQPIDLRGSFVNLHGVSLIVWLTAGALSLVWGLISFKIFVKRFSRMGPDEAETRDAVAYCLLPALIWLISFGYWHQSRIFPFWLFLSCGLCWAVLIYYPLMTRRSGSKDSASLLLVSLVLSFFLAPALLTGLKPLLFFVQGDQATETLSAVGAFLRKIQFVFPAIIALLGLFVSDKKSLLRFVFFPVQVILLLFLAVIIPGNFLVDDQVTRFFPAKPTFVFIVLPLLLLGLWDCVRRCLFETKKSPLSPFPLLAILLLVFFSRNPVPGYNNLYELGSRFPEFWVIHQGWATIFKDVYITYGLWDYGYLLLSFLFSGQFTPAASHLGGHLLLALLMTAQFFAISAVLPAGMAFLLCIWLGPGSHSVGVIFFSVLFIPALLRRPGAWILFWALLCGFAPFAKIPQGTFCVVASFPAYVWQAVILYKSNRKYFWLVHGILILWALCFFVGPFSDYFWGLLRIFSETARVNGPWAANVWEMGNSPFFAAVLGNAVIVAPLVAVIAAIVIIRSGNKENAPLAVFMLSSLVLVYSFCATSYGFSRTDWHAYLRQFQNLVTVLPLTMIVLMAWVRKRSVLWACLVTILCFMIFQPRNLPFPGQVLAKASTIPTESSLKLQDAGLFGLPHLGIGKFPPGHLEEEQALKEGLDRFLAPEETFLDLTMEGLNYYCSQRPMVTEYPVYYVFPGDAPQFRAIDQLRRHNVRVSLLDPFFFDNSPSPLRAHYLYRFGLLNGLPMEISPRKTLLMPPEYFSRAGITAPNKAEALQLLDKQFVQDNLNLIPVVWGRGYRKFAKDLHLVRTLKPAEVIVNGSTKEFRYPISAPLRGTEAGLLVIDVDMDPNAIWTMTARWPDGDIPASNNHIKFILGKGTLIIPLDTSPRWLLGRAIDSLTLVCDSTIAPQKRGDLWDKSVLPAVPLVFKRAVNARMDQGGRLEADNPAPYLFYTLPKSCQGKDVLVRLVVRTPQNVGFTQIFYKKPSMDYNENDSERMSAVAGRNEIYFQIPANMTEFPEVRINVGNIQGQYIIHSVEAKPIEIRDKAPSLTITRADLMQRRMVNELKLDTLGPWESLK